MKVNRPFYAVVRGLFALFCRVYLRMSKEGAENLPRHGAYIVAPVHRSFVDTPIVAALTTRPMRFMGKSGFFKVKVLGTLWQALGAFPVNRDVTDRASMRLSLDLLAQGEALVVFPEGTRRSGPVLEGMHEGVAYLALRAGVPIVPVAIGGSEEAMPRRAKFIRPSRVHVIVGEPIAPPANADSGRIPRRAVTELTEKLRSGLQEGFDRAQTVVAKTHE